MRSQKRTAGTNGVTWVRYDSGIEYMHASLHIARGDWTRHATNPVFGTTSHSGN